MSCVSGTVVAMLTRHSHLLQENDNVVYCCKSPATIKKRVFTVNHLGGTNDRWSNEIACKYSKKDHMWYLLEVVDKDWNVFHLDKIDSAVKTKKDFGIVPFQKYNSAEMTCNCRFNMDFRIRSFYWTSVMRLTEF